MEITATRQHTISCGHRVTNHESKCTQLHGHNYTFHITVGASTLDSVGRVLDFNVIKTVLTQWLEDNWDHKFILYENDPLYAKMSDLPGVILVPFNPTAENMAEYLATMKFPELLYNAGLSHVKIASLTIDETPKCSVTLTTN